MNATKSALNDWTKVFVDESAVFIAASNHLAKDSAIPGQLHYKIMNEAPEI